MINREDLFSKDIAVYWEEKYEPIVEFLKGGLSDSSVSSSVFRLNVEVVVFAACIGLVEDRRIKSSGKTKEISVSTFHQNGLSQFLYLIPFLSTPDPDLDLLRNEDGEKSAVGIFQEYAAGGLSIILDEYSSSTIRAPYLFLMDLLKRYPKAPDSGGSVVINDIDIDIF
jgi:hypothetical protein